MDDPAGISRVEEIRHLLQDAASERFVSAGPQQDAGMVLTGAGAPFPYGKDPKDSNIRIAPSYPSPEELLEASKVLALCTKIAAIEKIIEA